MKKIADKYGKCPSMFFDTESKAVFVDIVDFRGNVYT